MHIVIANPRGFCAGVARAVLIVHRALIGSDRLSARATRSFT